MQSHESVAAFLVPPVSRGKLLNLTTSEHGATWDSEATAGPSKNKTLPELQFCTFQGQLSKGRDANSA